MSRQDREALQAWLKADPFLRTAWDEFNATLARISGPIGSGRQPSKSELAELREAALRVRAAAGEGQTEH